MCTFLTTDGPTQILSRYTHSEPHWHFEALTECPHSQVAKDPERGLTECLEGGGTAFALVANLLL
jgi:hypothetical protein